MRQKSLILWPNDNFTKLLSSIFRKEGFQSDNIVIISVSRCSVGVHGRAVRLQLGLHHPLHHRVCHEALFFRIQGKYRAIQMIRMMRDTFLTSMCHLVTKERTPFPGDVTFSFFKNVNVCSEIGVYLQKTALNMVQKFGLTSDIG